MTRLLLSVATFCMFSHLLSAQKCHTMQNYFQQLAADPSFGERRSLIEEHTREFELSSSGSERTIITIPVVFHVIHNGDAYGVNENITDEIIYSQIDALNRDFRRMNSDTSFIPGVFKPLAADCDINFCLAHFDESGNLTNGITRHNLGAAKWDRPVIESTLKPSTIWSSDNYLNIWSVNFDWGAGAELANVLGYAQFPGGAANTDGVALLYTEVGVQAGSIGRTATHEVGHWLNLLHVWGDDMGACTGDDLVGDTPNQADENYGCPTFPHVSCSNGPNGDMFMNYMDYINDECALMFSLGQKTRMQAALASPTARLDIANSQYLCDYNLDLEVTTIMSPDSGSTMCSNSIVPLVKLTNLGSDDITDFTLLYSFDGGASDIYNWVGGLLPSGSSTIVTLPAVTLANGAHTMTATSFNPNGVGGDDYAGNDEFVSVFDVLNSGPASASLPFSEGFEASFPPAGWSIVNPNADREWEMASIGAYTSSLQSASFDNFTTSPSPIGKVDGLVTPDIDFSTANYPTLKFDYAYTTRNSTKFDSLKIYFSTNCGDSWTLLWQDGNTNLATTVANLSEFTPGPSEWFNKTVSLETVEKEPKVRLMFENKSGNGNNLYLDNINIASAGVGFESFSEKEIQISPNPANDFLNISYPSKLPVQHIRILSIEGKELMKFDGLRTNLYIQNLTNGLYFVEFDLQSQRITKKIEILKQ